MAVYKVALRKESVDRNPRDCYLSADQRKSLSARRAWIEIAEPCKRSDVCRVALRKESVDRNVGDLLSGGGIFGRSPQGERG